MNALIVAVLLSLLAPAARAASNDCLFDGTCAPRSAAHAAPDASDAAPVLEGSDGAPAAGLSLVSGLRKGASEGALLGFYAGLSPALKLVDEGFGRRMSRGADGPRSDNGHGDAYFYGGMALAAVLYLPALVLSAVGGLFGGAAGAAAPGAAKGWDAEGLLFGDRRR
jgi:hypothetical protein